ncbi:1-deoxy-D-xylulose-5-phosphate synthase [Chromatiales bacterium (ex Bugula neritina AB1)]|nr:1-deoxy-D-xylulose-5-phosphate synthase [Chromatiales bacterium (ex Bugula neritina AB1)]
MLDSPDFPLLDNINQPRDLKDLSSDQLVELADELRRYLVNSVARTGGHLGASLGTVELTIALHHVFNTPVDRLVWDVGHQTYPHKILTGRKDRMHTMRMKGGLAGFPKRSESEYDTFGVGHSSTSISAALGMALAAGLKQEDRKVVAVIGDGALTAGMAFEALNNAGDQKANLLVILNDNDMSISPNVGALNKYLTRILTSRAYTGAREGGKRILKHIPPVMEFAKRTEEHMKGFIVEPATMFEELGFQYFGPVDGHDLPNLVKVLSNLNALSGPLLLHAVTQKGKGYKFAEEDALALHAVTPFDPSTGQKLSKSKSSGPTYTEVFGNWLCDIAAANPRVVGITPAMREGSGLVEFEQKFPERYFDVGIAEQHSVTLAAGLACEGMKPVVAIYSTFMQRAYDQIVHDVAIQNLPVLFAIDRAGLVGPDGPTHAGSFDYSFLRCLPNMVVMAPADENECRQMLYTGLQLDGPAAVRYPRGTGPGVAVEAAMQTLPIGKGSIIANGRHTAILAFGSMVATAATVGAALGATVANMRFILPLDETLIAKLAATHDTLITVEENTISGGAGSAINECLHRLGIEAKVLNIGLPNNYFEHGDRGELLADCGLDEAGISRQINTFLTGQQIEAPEKLTVTN